MSRKTPVFYDNSHSITTREQEVLDLLLAGQAPKEIGFRLNISYDTVLSHQKNLYRKLDVHSVDELLKKYPAETGKNEKSPQKETVFLRWDLINDDFGSSIDLTSKIEIIREQYWTTYTLEGEMSPKTATYAAAVFFPDSSTLEAMKKMKRFSFTALGDGQTYEIKLATHEIRQGSHNYYHKLVTPPKNEITVIYIYIDELVQSPFYPGKPEPFIQESIELLQIQTHSKGEFKLKIWDVRFNC